MIPHAQKEKLQHEEQETLAAVKPVRNSQIQHSSFVGLAMLAGLVIVALLCGGIMLFSNFIADISGLPPN